MIKVVPLENFAIAALNKAFPTRRVVFLGVAACAHPEPPQSDALGPAPDNGPRRLGES